MILCFAWVVGTALATLAGAATDAGARVGVATIGAGAAAIGAGEAATGAGAAAAGAAVPGAGVNSAAATGSIKPPTRAEVSRKIPKRCLFIMAVHLFTLHILRLS
jgi:hypothetical protein